MNVLLIYGGKSVEHDISVITACITRSLFYEHKLFCCYIDENGVAWLVRNDLHVQLHKDNHGGTKAVFLCGDDNLYTVKLSMLKKICKIDCAVNCCHGSNGEDGSLSGVLQLSNIPQVQGGVLSSAIAMDKDITKQLLKANGFSVTEGRVLADYEPMAESDFPLVVKPLSLGSSVAVERAENNEQLKHAVENAKRYCKQVIVEKALNDFVEVNCSALRNNGKIETGELQYVSGNTMLSFYDKYENGDFSSINKNYRVDKATEKIIEDSTKRIYELFRCSGVVRVDYFVTPNGVLVNELNSIPGSLAYGLWEKKYPKRQFGNILLQDALANHQWEAELQFDFKSAVIKNVIAAKR